MGGYIGLWVVIEGYGWLWMVDTRDTVSLAQKSIFNGSSHFVSRRTGEVACVVCGAAKSCRTVQTFERILGFVKQ